MTDQEKQIIRDLAQRVAEIAALPVQQEKREMWTRLNRLERVRPLIHVQAIAPDIWEEMLPPEQLVTTDPLSRGQEMLLRRRLYCWEHFRDDRVVDDVIPYGKAIRGGPFHSGFGIRTEVERTGRRSGAHAFKPVIVEERDIEKIDTAPEVTYDHEATEHHGHALRELYDGILRVEAQGPAFFWFAPVDKFIEWRGIEQFFTDLVDRPQWVHEGLERVTACYMHTLDQLEAQGLLSPGHGNTLLGSGGYGFTDQLPPPGYDSQHVRLKDLWARAATQIFTDGISPAMHDEFAIRYEKRLLERFGLSCYGCCEPLHRKMGVVRRIRNLRRVSMSPWVDLDMASGAVGKEYIYTHKPNPAIVSMEAWHPELAREQLREAFEKTRENVVEVNLQDLHTLRGEPRRLTEWTRIAMELAEEYA